ncbi:hypothetical protein O9992_15910 [Vibrio lentus]|nr:hypothetical protein [Vibrio lentus]
MSIIAFLLILGMMTVLLTLSGGTSCAFAEWAQSRVKSKRGSKLLCCLLRRIHLVDDVSQQLSGRCYLSSCNRPLLRISRQASLYPRFYCYPMCVIMPALKVLDHYYYWWHLSNTRCDRALALGKACSSYP